MNKIKNTKGNNQEKQEFQQNFHKKVLLRLGEMLKILKQGERQENRVKLQTHCQKLSKMGKDSKMRQWIELVETASLAISLPENPYQACARIIVKEIKEAGELVLTGQASQIKISEKLQSFATLSDSKMVEIETICQEWETNTGYIGTREPELWETSTLTNEDKVELETEKVKKANKLAEEKQIEEEDKLTQELVNIFQKEEKTQEIAENELFLEEDYIEEETVNYDHKSAVDELSILFEENQQTSEISKRDLDLLEENLGNHENILGDSEEISETPEKGKISRETESTKTQGKETSQAVTQETLEELVTLFDLDIQENESSESLDLKNEKVVEKENQDNSVLEELEEIAKENQKDTDLLEDLETLELSLQDISQELEEEAENPFAELENWLKEENKEEAKTTPGDKREDKEIVLYEQIEKLEEVIAAPPSTLLEEINISEVWKQLKNLIESPADERIVELTNSGNPYTLSKQEEDVLTKIESQLELEEEKEVEDILINEERNKNISEIQLKEITKPKVFSQSIRVPIEQLNTLNNLIGEIVVKRNRLEQDQQRLHQFLDNLLNRVQNLGEIGSRMQELYERSLLEGALLASRNQSSSFPTQNIHLDVSSPEQNLNALEMDRFTGFHLLTQEMIEQIVRVREASSDIQYVVDETEQVGRTMRQVSTQLQETINKSRMVPFAQTTDRLPRAVRDISQKSKKLVELKVEGREVLIDKMIVEHLNSPMTHLVNNAIAHGIELPEERIQQGKPKKGKILVRAFLQGNQTVISVSDDGGGINPEKIKQKAIQRGLITRAQAKNLRVQEVYDLLFHPGFSTEDQANEIAGRGVGLDAVRTNLNDIRGTIIIDSTIGKGTTFTIRLPLMLSICKALCCQINKARLAFPMDGVEDMQDYDKNDLKINQEGIEYINWRDRQLEIHQLDKLLHYNRQLTRSRFYNKQEQDTVSIVVLRGGDDLLAIKVDQVLGEEEIVIKQIEGPIPKPQGITGATVLGDGSVMPIGDVLELIAIAQGKPLQIPELNTSRDKVKTLPSSQPIVLVVDDSITVRELLSISFTKAGYRVEQARDGQEAWDKLVSGLPCDVVFSDIEMPRLSGLELLSKMQEDSELSAIPVAILSSRGADKHKDVAKTKGAKGYLVKPYTEKQLLDTAKRMIEGETLIVDKTKEVEELTLQENPTVSSPKTTKPEIALEELKAIREKSEKNRLKPRNTPSTYNSDHPIVLIIDDSVVVREMLSMSFKKAGYHVEQARDGQDAWEKLSGGLPCNIILCDIEMPRMNGLELLGKIQKDEILSQIPVAMVTSRGAEKHRKIAAELGARAYFTKPYIENDLLNAAKRMLSGEQLLENPSKVK